MPHTTSRLRSVCLRIVSQSLITALVFVALSPTPAATAATGTYLQNSTLYPRLVRLSHGAKEVDGQVVASTNGNIFLSKDNGKSFTFLDTVPTQAGSTERCCATLYEVPETVGTLKAGTLLFAGSYFSGQTPAIEVYTSTDQGRTWTYSSMPVIGGDNNHGLWEPEFTIADDGALVMFWSDETDGCCSQKLAQIRTYNGTGWQDRINTVASLVQGDRPGMARVSKLPSGTFFMSYELCGPAACTVFSRTSQDGWNFGTASDTGTKVQTTTGQFFEHAPSNTWGPSVLSGDGALLLVGQVLFEYDGAVSPKNGKLLFVDLSGTGSGPWYTIPAPVKVPTAYNNYCPNYSSALLPSKNGSKLLEFASDYNSSRQCVSYFATERFFAPQGAAQPQIP